MIDFQIIDVVVMYLFIITIFVLFILNKKFLKKYAKLRKKNKEIENSFSNSVVGGIVGGTFLIIMQQIIEAVLNASRSFDISSNYHFILSITKSIVIVVLLVSLVSFTTSYFLYKGLEISNN